MQTGKVILLNGITSGGKSTLAQALQKLLDTPYLHADADAIKEMSRHVPSAEHGDAFARGAFMPQLYAGIPGCFASLAASGSNLIIEDVARPLQMRRYVDALSNSESVLIGVHCSQVELEWRERARGDRRIGSASEQLLRGLIHSPGIYDLEVDTTHRPAEECALEIMKYLARGPRSPAANKLAQFPLEELWDMTDEMDRAIYRASHPGLLRSD